MLSDKRIREQIHDPGYERAWRADRTALRGLARDVDAVPVTAWMLSTPCEGWDLLDLVEHLNSLHLQVCGGSRPRGDPARAFDLIADRWLAYFLRRSGQTMTDPATGAEVAAETFLARHLTDLILHRWDLNRALGRPAAVVSEDRQGIATAHAVADGLLVDGSRWVGQGRPYGPSLRPVPGEQALGSLLRRFGRDPDWVPARGVTWNAQ